jgi:uncharacterized protein (DUF2132 family)
LFVEHAIICDNLIIHGSDPHPPASHPMSSPNDPLHGITLEQIVTELSGRYGWEEMGQTIPIRCFQNNPSVKSSLTFLRKTPWARAKVESWYLDDRWKEKNG